MSEPIESDIREFLKGEVDKMNRGYKKQLKWIYGIVAAFLVLAITVGAYEVRQTQRNKSDIFWVKKEVRVSVDWVTQARVNHTYDLQFQAIESLLEGNDDRYEKIMESFKEFRWSLIQDKVEEQRKSQIFRGGSTNGMSSSN